VRPLLCESIVTSEARRLVAEGLPEATRARFWLAVALSHTMREAPDRATLAACPAAEDIEGLHAEVLRIRQGRAAGLQVGELTISTTRADQQLGIPAATTGSRFAVPSLRFVASPVVPTQPGPTLGHQLPIRSTR
jgi:hypothetical protein